MWRRPIVSIGPKFANSNRGSHLPFNLLRQTRQQTRFLSITVNGGESKQEKRQYGDEMNLSRKDMLLFGVCVGSLVFYFRSSGDEEKKAIVARGLLDGFPVLSLHGTNVVEVMEGMSSNLEPKSYESALSAQNPIFREVLCRFLAEKDLPLRSRLQCIGMIADTLKYSDEFSNELAESGAFSLLMTEAWSALSRAQKLRDQPGFEPPTFHSHELTPDDLTTIKTSFSERIPESELETLIENLKEKLKAGSPALSATRETFGVFLGTTTQEQEDVAKLSGTPQKMTLKQLFGKGKEAKESLMKLLEEAANKQAEMNDPDELLAFGLARILFEEAGREKRAQAWKGKAKTDENLSVKEKKKVAKALDDEIDTLMRIFSLGCSHESIRKQFLDHQGVELAQKYLETLSSVSRPASSLVDCVSAVSYLACDTQGQQVVKSSKILDFLRHTQVSGPASLALSEPISRTLDLFEHPEKGFEPIKPKEDPSSHVFVPTTIVSACFSVTNILLIRSILEQIHRQAYSRFSAKVDPKFANFKVFQKHAGRAFYSMAARRCFLPVFSSFLFWGSYHMENRCSLAAVGGIPNKENLQKMADQHQFWDNVHFGAALFPMFAVFGQSMQGLPMFSMGVLNLVLRAAMEFVNSQISPWRVLKVGITRSEQPQIPTETQPQ